MGKSRMLKRADTETFDMLNLGEMLVDSAEEATILEMLERIASIDRDQSQVSLDLTKLIVEHGSEGKKLKEQDILSTFKKAKQTVASCSPLQEMFEKVSS